ncbi:effector-associated constant component EACC1 [Nonomuraea polychroma]|uniref:effector-associated constant component EACC1 n=1 Tax=Nonomuraea polychroma TaxID=46176 RepID=UPI003D8A191D
MRVIMQVRGGGGRASDAQANELARYLNGQHQLRGRAHAISERRQSGGINQSAGAIVAEVGPYALVVASALITWIRHRTSDTRVTVRRPDGAQLEISAQRVRRLGAKDLNALAQQIAEALNDHVAVVNTNEGDPSLSDPDEMSNEIMPEQPAAIQAESDNGALPLAELFGTGDRSPDPAT